MYLNILPHRNNLDIVECVSMILGYCKCKKNDKH